MATSKNVFGSQFVSDRSFAVSSQKLDKTVFVNLDEKPAQAKVVRDGFQVPPVTADITRVDEFLSGLEILRPTEAPRVVAQSIAPGTKVGPGTGIDLVLAPRQDVPLKLFDDIHVAVRESNIEEVLTKVEADRTLKELVLKYDDADEVPAEDRQAMATRMKATANMEIDDTKPEQNFKKGFNAMRAVLAFK